MLREDGLEICGLFSPFSLPITVKNALLRMLNYCGDLTSLSAFGPTSCVLLLRLGFFEECSSWLRLSSVSDRERARREKGGRILISTLALKLLSRNLKVLQHCLLCNICYYCCSPPNIQCCSKVVLPPL